MICSSCQTVNRENSAFCMKCGEKLVKPSFVPIQAVEEKKQTWGDHDPQVATKRVGLEKSPDMSYAPVANPSSFAQPPIQMSGIVDGETIIITDVKMKFMSMVVFMLKWTLAMLIAFFIIAAILLIVLAIIMVVFALIGLGR